MMRKRGKMKLYHQQMVQKQVQVSSVLDAERRGTSPINAPAHKKQPPQCKQCKQRKRSSVPIYNNVL
eukprot:5916180-Ditylum_brightwellii.AAC.2